MSLEKIKKQRDENLRREMISKMLASFAVTAVVAVTVVVSSAPAEPAAARFLLLSAVSTEIVYRVNVSDPELTITAGSLKVVIESPYERYEEPIELGTSSGTHLMAYENSEYTLSVRAKRGFGEEILTKQSVVASHTLSGAIIDYHLDENIDLSSNQEQLRYSVSTLYDDPQSVVSSLSLEYGYLSSYVLDYDPEAVPEFFETIPITGNTQESWIENIPNYNNVVFVRFIAYLSSSEVVTFDSLQFSTPFILYASIYQTNVGSDFVEFAFFSEQFSKVDAAFTVLLYKGEKLIDSKVVEEQTTSSYAEFQQVIIRFDNLTPETMYRAVLMAEYIDPYTFEQMNTEVQTVDFSTLFVPSDTLSGIITGYEIDSSIDLSTRPQFLRYSISTFYQDPQLETASLSLQYGFLPTEMVIENPLAVPEYYESVSVYYTTQDTWIENIPNFNYTVFVRFVATLTNSDTVVLDDVQFTTPFVVSAFLYPSNVSIDFAELIFYIEQPLTIEVSFSIELYLGETLVDTLPIELPTDPLEQTGPHTVLIDNLSPETTYSAVLWAEYTDPETQILKNDELQTIEFTTLPNVPQILSGTINSFLLDETIDLQTNPEMLRYNISTYYEDPLAEVSSISLQYAYVPTDVLLANPSIVPQNYLSISISNYSQDSWIEGIPNFNSTVFLRLVAILTNLETVILDEMQFETPVFVMANMSLSDIGYDFAQFSFFSEPTTLVEVAFTVELFANEILIDSKSVPSAPSPTSMPNQGFNMQTIYFGNLSYAGPLFTAKLVASYIDPNTSETVNRILQTTEFNLTPFYTFQVSISETAYSYEVTVLVDDPQFVLSNFSYMILFGTPDNMMYVTSGILLTETPDVAQRIYTTSISKQGYAGYTFEILCDKTVNSVVYYSCLLYSSVL